MAQGLKELTEQALRLPPDERVTLAESLLLTIDEEHDRRVDEALVKELERRLQDFREGKVKRISAEEAFRRIRGKAEKSSVMFHRGSAGGVPRRRDLLRGTESWLRIAIC